MMHSLLGGKRTIFVSVGEESGDMYAAHLIEEIKDQAKGKKITFLGVGGSKIEQAGAKVLFNTPSIATLGITEPIPYTKKWSKVWRIVRKEVTMRRPELILAFSNDMFNLRLAKLAQNLHIPFIYTFAPEIWGWRSKIRLPFLYDRGEAAAKLSTHIISCFRMGYEAYAALGAKVTYVGHPFVDIVRHTRKGNEVKTILGISTSKPTIGILPGSRVQEVKNHLPIMLKACETINKNHTNGVEFMLIPTKNSQPFVERILPLSTISPVIINQNCRFNAIAACDFVIAASGTVVLEASCLNVPSIVIYKFSPLTWAYLQYLTTHAKWASLPNIISDREVVPELLQSNCTPSKISALAVDLLNNRDSLEIIRRDLIEVRNHLGEPGSFRRAAEVVMSHIK